MCGYSEAYVSVSSHYDNDVCVQEILTLPPQAFAPAVLLPRMPPPSDVSSPNVPVLCQVPCNSLSHYPSKFYVFRTVIRLLYPSLDCELEDEMNLFCYDS